MPIFPSHKFRGQEEALWKTRQVAHRSLGSILPAGMAKCHFRLMRLKPPHRGLLSLRLRTRRWKAVHAQSRCDGLFRGLGFFPLGKLLAHCRADHIRMDAVRFAASTRTLLPAWPESTQQRSGFKKRSAKRAISVRTTLFLFCRFFVFPYRFPHFVPVRPLRWPIRGLLRFWRLR